MGKSLVSCFFLRHSVYDENTTQYVTERIRCVIECGYLRVFSQSGRVDAHAAYRNNDGALIFINVSGVDEAGTQPSLMDTYISPSQLPAPRYDIYPPRTSCPRH